MPFGSEFPPSSRAVIENSIRPFSNGLWDCFLQMFLEITQFKIMENKFEQFYLVQNFPLSPEMSSKIQSDPSPLGYSLFSSNGLRKYTVYLHTYLNIARLFKISPWFQKWYRKFNPTLFHWTTGFFQQLFIWFLKKVSPRFFKGPFFIWSNIEPVFCPLVSPSVPQSVHQNVQYFLNRPRACFLSIENKFSFFFLGHF